MTKTIVIGAGPAGLSCAYELSKKGSKVIVLEANEHVGGMARSFDLWGQRVDLGPHRFFTKNEDVQAFFDELIKGKVTQVDRQTRIFYKGKFFQYPLRIANVLKNLSPITILRILKDYAIQKMFPIKNPKNFEEWVINHFGKALFHIFFKSYSEKLWGIECTEIDVDWAKQRIKSLSLFEAVKAAMFGGDLGKRHKTLVEQFAYPQNGAGALYDSAVEAIYENKGEVKTNCSVKRVLLNSENNKVIGVELLDGSVINAENVVSTMPLTTLVSNFKNVPEKVQVALESLLFRNTILVYIEIDNPFLFKDNWLYINSPDVRHGRITNFRNWCPSLNKGKDTTILCMEFWCFEKDDIWTEDRLRVSEMAIKELYQIKLISMKHKVLNSKVIKIPKCYPVYNTGYREKLDVVIDYLKGIDGLYPIGRYGSFKYNNQDHSILMGILAAKKIQDKHKVDLWSINSDTEYHE